MSNMRWRHGDTKPVVVPVASATVVQIGDLAYLASGAALPASAQADLGTLAQNQEGFHDAFIGVSMTRSPAGDTVPLTIATAGVFEFDCVSTSFALGALVGPAGTGAGGAVGLSNSVVEAVATPNLAIGRVNRATTSSTKVLVEIVGTVNHGGPMAMA